MQALNPAVDLQAFFESLGHARDCVLMLDYDGTLAPFHERPECARPYPEVAAALDELIAQARTRIVIVSGRELTDLLPLLAFTRRPEIWGAHGWQRLLPDGRRVERAAEPAMSAKLDQAERLAQGLEAKGARLERKPASLALHWRGLGEASAGGIRAAAASLWQQVLDGRTVELMDFDGGMELRALGHNKHHAVKTVLSETAGGSAVAYLGDDLTDEDAFAAVKARGLAVLVRTEPRSSRADLWIQPPDELVAFLKRWRERRATRN
ncbi:MAG TPA: trehalose-phosphatase [Burkholderiales bacterium]|nr:trehalose-phosphatase [Burkholderiales bacterium]